MTLNKINQSNKAISGLKEWTKQYAPEKERDSELQKLVSASSKLLKIEDAMNEPSAIGVFGESQCGKSYIVSELTGGTNSKVNIPGIKNKNFMNYNPKNVDMEATAVVTRLTSKTSDIPIPQKSVKVKFLSPEEIMWSFTYGFYSELKFGKGFNIDDNEKQDIKKQLSLDNGSSEFISDVNEFISQFGECITWVKNVTSVPELSEFAFHTLTAENVNKISLDRFVLIASTLWNNDKNITHCFRARVETLKHYKRSNFGYCPESLLQNVLKAKTLASLSLNYNSDHNFDFQDDSIIYEGKDPNLDVKTKNLQSILKEVILPVEVNNGPILPLLDVLDFPGARAGAGQIAGFTSEDIKNNIKDDNSEILANVFKRGKLLFLFDLYCRNFDITILLLCSQPGNQNAQIIKRMLEEWIDQNLSQNLGLSENIENSLFVALTKSDMLIKASSNTETNIDDRLTGRFRENFANYYGSWVNEFGKTSNPFNNFYLVRNPQADQNCFKTDQTGTELWRDDFDSKIQSQFKDRFLKNDQVEKYLSTNKEKLYDEVYKPGHTGIKYLIEKIINRHNEEPDLKKRVLDNAAEDVVGDLKQYLGRYYQGDDEDQIKKKKREKAQQFVQALGKTDNSVSILLNTIHGKCPGEKLLHELINKVSMSHGSAMISQSNPIQEGMIDFILAWFKGCQESKSLHGKIGINNNQLLEYFEQIELFITSKHVKNNELNGFDLHFDQEPSSIRSLRNYILWVVGRKLFYLTETEINGAPNAPIKIDESIRYEKLFRDNILAIWKEHLPEVYAGNFSSEKPPPGLNKLKEIAIVLS